MYIFNIVHVNLMY